MSTQEAFDLSDQQLLPIGTLYDPFVLRGLDAFVYSVYSESRFIVAGTPSGVTLAPEGGAHQSTITTSIGMELPNVTLMEPAFATALDWQICFALSHIADAGKGECMEIRREVPTTSGSPPSPLIKRHLTKRKLELGKQCCVGK